MHNKENQTSEKLEWEAPLLIDLNAEETKNGYNGNPPDGGWPTSLS